jgi:hypothetical protein
MKFSLWTQYGALNSTPIFDAFRRGAASLGHTCIDNRSGGDVDVIWSVLWNGRMAKNKAIWDRNVLQSKPTLVLEVGGIQRGTTWKVGLNGINRDAYFGPKGNNDTRARRFGLTPLPWRDDGKYILLCGQHEKSEQWRNMPSMSKWVMQTIEEIRTYTDRPIMFRPHPRCPLPHIEHEFKNVVRQQPQQMPGTYDDFDMRFSNIWATVNWSSNPGIHSILNGVPAFVGPSSLAYDVANHSYANIESPLMPDRQQWINDYAHTEYTVDEISKGIPIKHLTAYLS